MARCGMLEQSLDLAECSMPDHFIGGCELHFIEVALDRVEQACAGSSLPLQCRGRSGEQDAQGNAMSMDLSAQSRDFVFHSDSPVMVGAHRMADLPGMDNRVRQGGAA